MANDRAPGKDGITAKMIKSAGYPLWKALAERFTMYLEMGQVPKTWKEAKTILIFKKGNRKDLKNYRPICLLSHVYKLFTKVILNRISKTLDEEQPREQAGFRSQYSTMDHLFTINRLLETAKEYRLPICLAFVDYEKAFDSVEFNAVLQALANQGIDDSYIRILLEPNTGCTTEIQLKDNVVTVLICKRVK